MPAVARPRHVFGMVGVEDGLDFAQVIRPAEQPEGAARDRGDAFKSAKHGTLIPTTKPKKTGPWETIVPASEMIYGEAHNKTGKLCMLPVVTNKKNQPKKSALIN